MTQIDGRPEGDAEHMPARWWSIQWVTSRLFYAVVAALLIVRGVDYGGPLLYLGSLLALTAVLFGAFTAIALYYRRRWAREHS